MLKINAFVFLSFTAFLLYCCSISQQVNKRKAKMKGLSNLVVLASVFGEVKVIPKQYECNKSSGFCDLVQSPSEGLSQNVCLLTCGNGNIWPYPKTIDINDEISHFCQVSFASESKLGNSAFDNFMDSLEFILPNVNSSKSSCISTQKLLIDFNIEVSQAS